MKKINKLKKYTFHNEEYPIEKGNLDFSSLVNKFITENRKYFKNYISVICQVRESDNSHFTLGDRFPIEVANDNDIRDYIDYITNKVALLDGRYHPDQALGVYLNYTNIDQGDYILNQNIIRLSNFKSEVDFTEDVPLELPLNTEYLNWGSVTEWLSSNVAKVNDLTIDASKKLNRYIEVTFRDKINRSIIVFSNVSGLDIARFTDKVVNQLKDEFIRQVGDRSYHIKNNKLFFLFERIYPKDFITSLKPNKKFNLDLMTLDVETYLDAENKMSIYCISIYDGEKSKSFYLTDYYNIDSLIKDLLSTIFSRKYSGKNIYIHNSSEFDLVFLMKYLVSYGSTKVEPVIKDGKFINIDVRFGPHYLYKLSFRDSILLLPGSLAKLSKAFNVDNVKDLFPHKFVTRDNLNFVGAVPSIEFFSGLSVSEYDSYKSRFLNNDWSLKAEAIKYCELDCKSLYEVIMNFSNHIFKDFKINTSTTPTLPSAAFKIFRSNFIPTGFKLPAITGKYFDDLNEAFYGGHVDMYLPKNVEGTKVYHYDINSLYPYAMKTFKYPTNFVAYFKGNVSNMPEYNKMYKDCVGFYKVKVTSPKNITHPLLPVKINNSSVYAEGTWTGWYYSEELNNAVKYGYSYEILEGYLFNSDEIFAAYVDRMYKMKEESQKDSPGYVISKLLMNSLYGRFGMKRSMINHEIVKQKNVNSFIAKIGFENLVNKLDIGNKTIISYKLQFQRTPKINMAISAAITANARIVMSQFKNNPQYQLFVWVILFKRDYN